MATGFTPYLIGNMRYGVELGVESWLLPSEAYAQMKNAYLRRGVLSKRRGRALFGRVPHGVVAEAVGALGTDNYTGTLTKIPVQIGTVEFTDATLVITDDGDGTLSGDGSGTIDYTTGDYDITFSGNTTDAVTVDYSYYPGYAGVGIESHQDSTAGTSNMLAFDLKRAAYYDEADAEFKAIGGTDIWTGTSANVIWGANYQDRLFVTNNKDRVQSYNGTTFSSLLMDLDGDADNDVDTCLLIFQYKERLLVLRTTEGGFYFPQRARWCAIGDPDDWTNDGYVDAPTIEWIIAADFIKDDLVVFFQASTWRLRYTGDDALPFRWERISGVDGAYGPYTGFNFSDKMGAVGETSINETDGLQVYGIDEKVPDAASSFDHENFGLAYAIPDSALKQIIISYPQIGSTANDYSLVYNYEDKAWSEYNYGYNAYGYFKVGQSGVVLDDVTDVLDTIVTSFDDVTVQAGYPTVVGIDSSGYVWTVNSGSDDSGSAIEFDVMSGRWNPFLKDGQRARLGWVDLLVSHDPGSNLRVDFYVDHDATAYTDATEACGEGAPLSADSKVWVRYYAGGVGDFHRIRMYNNAAGQSIRVHAVVPYFKPAGPVRG